MSVQELSDLEQEKFRKYDMLFSKKLCRVWFFGYRGFDISSLVLGCSILGVVCKVTGISTFEYGCFWSFKYILFI